MIDPLFTAFAEPIRVFIMVLARLGGLLVVAPIFGSLVVPVRVRALLALGISALLTPLVLESATPVEESAVDTALAIGHELVLGLAHGLAMLILFNGFQLAGQVISQMSGMALADVFDPTAGGSVPVFSQLLNLVAVGVFAAMNGHRMVMSALLDSFAQLPAGGVKFSAGFVDLLVQMTTTSFAIGLRTAAPIMLALLLAIIILGLISRTLPQLNVIAVGFSLNALLVLTLLFLTMGTIGWLLQSQVEELLARLGDIV